MHVVPVYAKNGGDLSRCSSGDARTNLLPSSPLWPNKSRAEEEDETPLFLSKIACRALEFANFMYHVRSAHKYR